MAVLWFGMLGFVLGGVAFSVCARMVVYGRGFLGSVCGWSVFAENDGGSCGAPGGGGKVCVSVRAIKKGLSSKGQTSFLFLLS